MPKIVSTNPAKNYEIIGEVEISTENEIEEKVAKAKKAFLNWKSIGLKKRIDYLSKLVEVLIENKDKLAKLATIEMGMPIAQTKFDLDESVRYFTWYLDNAEKYLSPETVYEDDTSKHVVFYEPMGVAAVISPWNFPLSLFVWSVAQNLIVGNTVVYKASKECIMFGKLLEEIINRSGLPDGVFNEVYGSSEVGNILANQNINLINFTGSTQVGQSLYKIAGEKFIKAVMELGGSAAGIIFEDADIDNILETIYINRFTNAGQVCDGLKRLIVHESKFDEVTEKLVKLLQAKKLGNPEEESTDIGSLVSKVQLEILEEQVKDALSKGAKVIIGGKQPANLLGAYYEPTILTNISKEMKVWNEEVFGPVLPIVTFDTEDKAIRMANDTNYGLGGYIYTKDQEKALRISKAIETGMISVNNAMYLQPSSPFGGMKNSGIGREHGKFGFSELTHVKVVAFEK